jgi:hypothetical protein
MPKDFNLRCAAGKTAHVWLQGKGGALTPGQGLVLLPPKQGETDESPVAYRAPTAPGADRRQYGPRQRHRVRGGLQGAEAGSSSFHRQRSKPQGGQGDGPDKVITWLALRRRGGFRAGRFDFLAASSRSTSVLQKCRASRLKLASLAAFLGSRSASAHRSKSAATIACSRAVSSMRSPAAPRCSRSYLGEHGQTIPLPDIPVWLNTNGVCTAVAAKFLASTGGERHRPSAEKYDGRFRVQPDNAAPPVHTNVWAPSHARLASSTAPIVFRVEGGADGLPFTEEPARVQAR